VITSDPYPVQIWSSRSYPNPSQFWKVTRINPNPCTSLVLCSGMWREGGIFVAAGLGWNCGINWEQWHIYVLYVIAENEVKWNLNNCFREKLRSCNLETKVLKQHSAPLYSQLCAIFASLDNNIRWQSICEISDFIWLELAKQRFEVAWHIWLGHITGQNGVRS